MKLSKRSAPKFQAVPTADPEVGAKPSPSKRSARQPSFGEASRGSSLRSEEAPHLSERGLSCAAGAQTGASV